MKIISDYIEKDRKMKNKILMFWFIVAIVIISSILIVIKPTKLGLDLVGGSRLVLEAVVKAENIETSEEDFEAELKKMAETYKMELDQIKEFMGDYEKKQIKEDLAIQKAVDVIVGSVAEK